MKKNMIRYIPSNCSGCMSCMTACSTYHTGATSLVKARIRITRHEGHALTRMDQEDELIFDRICCRQCKEPACIPACPENAIQKNRHTGVVTINENTCTKCKLCMDACPFNAVFCPPDESQMLKCDLCGGAPQCVRFCRTGALLYSTGQPEETR